MKILSQKHVNIALTVLCCLISIPLIFNNVVDGDEAVTIMRCRGSVSEFVRWAAGDVHPPLYYILLHFMLKITGDSVIAAKFLALIPQAGFIAIGYFMIRKEFGVREMVVWDILVSCFPNMIKYSVTVRMYSWAGFFVLLTAFALYYLMKNDGILSWTLFTVFAIMAAYTHYYALITVMWLYCVLLVICVKRKRARKIIVSVVIAIAAYFPWLLIFLSQTRDIISNGFYMTETNPFRLAANIFGANKNNFFNICILAVWMVISVWSMIMGIREGLSKPVAQKDIWSMGVLLTFPIVFIGVYAFSLAITPIISARYMLIPAILYMLGVATQTRRLKRGMLYLVCAFFLLIGVKNYRTEIWQIRRAAPNYQVDAIEQGAAVYTPDWNVLNVLQYYRPDLEVEYCDNEGLGELDRQEGFYIAGKDIADALDANAEMRGQYSFKHISFNIYYIYERLYFDDQDKQEVRR